MITINGTDIASLNPVVFSDAVNGSTMWTTYRSQDGDTLTIYATGEIDVNDHEPHRCFMTVENGDLIIFSTRSSVVRIRDIETVKRLQSYLQSYICEVNYLANVRRNLDWMNQLTGVPFSEPRSYIYDAVRVMRSR